MVVLQDRLNLDISIHAPREGGDYESTWSLRSLR